MRTNFLVVVCLAIAFIAFNAFFRDGGSGSVQVGPLSSDTQRDLEREYATDTGQGNAESEYIVPPTIASEQDAVPLVSLTDSVGQPGNTSNGLHALTVEEFDALSPSEQMKLRESLATHAKQQSPLPKLPSLNVGLPDLSADGLPSPWGDKKDLANAKNVNPNEWISCARRQLRLLVQTPQVQHFKVGETIRIEREIRNVSSSPLFVPLSPKGVGDVGMLQAFIERLGEEKLIPPEQTQYVRGEPSVYGAGGTVLESSILIDPGESLKYVGDAKIKTNGYLPGEYLYSVHFSKGGKLIDYAEYKFVLE